MVHPCGVSYFCPCSQDIVVLSSIHKNEPAHASPLNIFTKKDTTPPGNGIFFLMPEYMLF